MRCSKRVRDSSSRESLAVGRLSPGSRRVCSVAAVASVGRGSDTRYEIVSVRVRDTQTAQYMTRQAKKSAHRTPKQKDTAARELSNFPRARHIRAQNAITHNHATSHRDRHAVPPSRRVSRSSSIILAQSAQCWAAPALRGGTLQGGSRLSRFTRHAQRALGT